MIIEWLVGLAGGVLDWVAGLFGSDDPPALLGDVAGVLADLVTGAAGLGGWVPWAYLGGVAATVLTIWGLLVTVKAVRWFWGLTPLGWQLMRPAERRQVRQHQSRFDGRGGCYRLGV